MTHITCVYEPIGIAAQIGLSLFVNASHKEINCKYLWEEYRSVAIFLPQTSPMLMQLLQANKRWNAKPDKCLGCTCRSSLRTGLLKHIDHVLINYSAVMAVLLESHQWAQASSGLWYVDYSPHLRNSLSKAYGNWLHYWNLTLTIPPIIYLFP